MKKLFLAVVVVGGFTLGLAGPAFANNPHSPANPTGPATGQPSQTCQTLTTPPSNTGPQYPGNTSASPGSPFNEALPGNGGTHYSGNSQYDVACFQQISHL